MKKQPNEILALWVELFPQDEEVKEVHAPSDRKAKELIRGLVRFIRAARHRKMVQFDETKVSLVQKYVDILAGMTKSKPFELIYADLEKIVKTSDVRLAIETISILDTPAA